MARPSPPARPRHRTARPLVTIVTPSLATANNGNWQTAARWARMLRGAYRVRIVTAWSDVDALPDLLIALHARRSAHSIAAFAAAHPERPLIVALTGTDLYRDIDEDADARRSLQLATRLAVLNDLGIDRLPARFRDKAVVIVQSARLRARVAKFREFTVAVVGHLRSEKNPQLVWDVLEGWPRDVPLRVLHAGRALEPALGARAADLAARDQRYRWLGDQPRGRMRRQVGASHVLLHPSRMEGGALAVIEAVTAHTPVIASRIDGNAGLLGAGYSGLFPLDDAAAARALLLRAATEPRFLSQLSRHCDRLRARFAPEREQRDLRRLVDNCLRASVPRARSPSRSKAAR
jgi:putative glycosyltransferase (TIGR04348 family)